MNVRTNLLAAVYNCVSDDRQKKNTTTIITNTKSENKPKH